MLSIAWEPIASSFANASEEHFIDNCIVSNFSDFIHAASVAQKPQGPQEPQEHLSMDSSFRPLIFIGQDTRISSSPLAELLKEAVQAAGGIVVDYGIVTTPQLHWAVGSYNDSQGWLGNTSSKQHFVTDNTPLETTSFAAKLPLVNVYYNRMVRDYTTCITLSSSKRLSPSRNNSDVFLIDCANGVGAVAVSALSQLLSQLSHFQMYGYNLPTFMAASVAAIETSVETTAEQTNTTRADIAVFTGPVNQKCGAEYVQKSKTAPTNFSKVFRVVSKQLEEIQCAKSGESNRSAILCASVDGDADRLVFFSQTPDSSDFTLFDGDRLSSICATYLLSLLRRVRSFREESLESKAPISALQLPQDVVDAITTIATGSIGVVQTAYSNGASTSYLRSLGQDLAIRCAHTGVKHLHNIALEYDVGIYFEANGHGTVMFSSPFLHALARVSSFIVQISMDRLYDSPKAPIEEPLLSLLSTVDELYHFSAIFNRYIGDALADFFAIHTALSSLEWTLDDVSALYMDLPSTMTKVVVNDRSKVKTKDGERICVAPVGLQAAINAAISDFQDPMMRCFVRPSGTEDIVRVYAEARTQHDADKLCEAVSCLVTEFC